MLAPGEGDFVDERHGPTMRDPPLQASASSLVGVGNRFGGGSGMTQYGTLRAWAFIATLVGIFGMIAAAIGAIVWAFEVEGFWQTIGVLLIGLPVAVFIATLPIALAQALRAIADVGDTVAAR